MATIATTRETQAGPRGLMAWLTTVDHKKIGIMYVLTTFTFFVLGVIIAHGLLYFSQYVAGPTGPPDRLRRDI